jgi:hypothetical protein
LLLNSTHLFGVLSGKLYENAPLDKGPAASLRYRQGAYFM